MLQHFQADDQGEMVIGEGQAVDIKISHRRVVNKVVAAPLERLRFEIAADTDRPNVVMLQMLNDKSFSTAGIQNLVGLSLLYQIDNDLVKPAQQQTLYRIRIQMFLSITVIAQWYGVANRSLFGTRIS